MDGWYLCAVVLDRQLDALDLCERLQLGETEGLVGLREADDEVHLWRGRGR